jgi:hypothetical protein
MMSIKGLTDQPRKRLPRLAQLRKGEKKTEANKPGKDLTYFRFVCNDPAVVELFKEKYGNEPRKIRVILPYATIEENFPTWREEWGKGSLKHRCDGETMVLWQDEHGIYQKTPKPCPYANLPKGDPGRKCKETGLLYTVLPDLLPLRWGYVEAVTTSQWDCLELTANLAAIEDNIQRVSIMTGRPLSLQGVPCYLWRAPRDTSCPGPNGRVRREKWLLHLEVDPDYMMKVQRLMQAYALPAIEAPQLSAPALELDYDPGEEEEITEPDPEPESLNGNGRKFTRDDFVARIRALEQESADLGQPVHYDEATLDEAKPDELKAIGRELRAKVDALWGKQEQAALL